MRVLQLCHKPPLPPLDGGCMAMHMIAEGLLDAGLEVKVLTLFTQKHAFSPQKMPVDFVEKTAIEGIFLDTRVTVKDAFFALLRADSYNVRRFFSAAFDERLKTLLSRAPYDLIHLESLFTTPYISTIRSLTDAKIVLRSHNIEHLIWERLANTTTHPLKKRYLQHLASRLKTYERQQFNSVDAIACISQEDAVATRRMGSRQPIATIPFGVRMNRFPRRSIRPPRMPIRLFHIGAMNWMPNIEGVNWFLNNVWPQLDHRQLHLHLAGRALPEQLYSLASPSCWVHGEVASAEQFISDGDVMIVPLLSGSGMRIKVIEAMALGKAIVSTTVGVEGIPCESGKHLLIADSPTDFKAAIQTLVEDTERIRELGRQARAFVEQHYNAPSIIDQLVRFYRTL